VEVTKILLEHGARLDICNKDGETPLLRCICSGNVAVVQLLFEHGASLNVSNVNGETALNQAQHLHFTELAALASRTRREVANIRFRPTYVRQ